MQVSQDAKDVIAKNLSNVAEKVHELVANDPSTVTEEVLDAHKSDLLEKVNYHTKLV